MINDVGLALLALRGEMKVWRGCMLRDTKRQIII